MERNNFDFSFQQTQYYAANNFNRISGPSVSSRNVQLWKYFSLIELRKKVYFYGNIGTKRKLSEVSLTINKGSIKLTGFETRTFLNLALFYKPYCIEKELLNYRLQYQSLAVIFIRQKKNPETKEMENVTNITTF